MLNHCPFASSPPTLKSWNTIQYNAILHVALILDLETCPLSIVRVQRRWMEKSAYGIKKDEGESKRNVLRPNLKAAKNGFSRPVSKVIGFAA